MEAEMVELSGANYVPVTPETFFEQSYSPSTYVLTVSFINPWQPALGTSTSYTIRIKTWDQYNILTPRYHYVFITVKLNKAPYLKPVNTINFNLGSIKVPSTFTTSFMKTEFIDEEGDNIIVTCNDRKLLGGAGTPATWTTATETAGKITIAGVLPGDNAWAGNYEFKCTVEDQF